MTAQDGHGAPPPVHRSGQAAIVGRANVGKSTLLNRLLGRKLAIVSSVPQTTRHRVLGVRTLPHGQVAFIDSPGFHRARHQLGELLLEQADAALDEADVLLWVVDASEGLGPGDRFVHKRIVERGRGRPVILVANKLDTMNKGRVLPLIEEATSRLGCVAAVPVSAETGANVEELLEEVVARLPEGPPLYPPDYSSDQDERQFIAEIIREKLLGRLHHELPHSIAVLVERTIERDDGLLEIDATIFVEKKSQKGIVIGRGGEMLKTVGSLARRELEERLDRHLFLRLWVKVREDWRDRVALLRELGVYGS